MLLLHGSWDIYAVFVPRPSVAPAGSTVLTLRKVWCTAVHPGLGMSYSLFPIPEPAVPSWDILFDGFWPTDKNDPIIGQGGHTYWQNLDIDSLTVNGSGSTTINLPPYMGGPSLPATFAWKDYDWPVDLATIPKPPGIATWEPGVYHICSGSNSKHEYGGYPLWTPDELWVEWFGERPYATTFEVSPGVQVVNKRTKRIDLHRRAAGERAVYEDEFLTKNQLEQGDGVLLRYRDEAGVLRNSDGTIAKDSYQINIPTDAEQRQKIRIDGCGMNVAAFSIDVNTRVGCWATIMFDHQGKTHLGFTADIAGTSNEIEVEYSSYFRFAVDGDQPVDYVEGTSFAFQNNYRFEGIDFQNPTHTLDESNLPVGYDSEIVFQLSYADQNTDPLLYPDLYGPDYNPLTVDSRVGDAAPRVKLRAFAKTSVPSARTQHAVHATQQPTGYPQQQNANPLVVLNGAIGQDVQMIPWDDRATILHQREYGTFAPFPLSQIAGNVWFLTPEAGCWEFNVYVEGKHGNAGLPYPPMRYDIHLVALTKDGDTGALTGWPDVSSFLQKLDIYQWVDQGHTPALDDGPAITMMDSVPWSVQGSLRVRIGVDSNQNAVGFALVFGYPPGGVPQPEAGYRTFEVNYITVDLQKVHDDYASYYTALTDPPYPNVTPDDVRFQTIH